jgi:hypothetical protein
MLDEARVATDNTRQCGIEVGSLVQLRIASGRMLWRIGPAWAVVAGTLTSGAPLLATDALLRLAAAIVLADLLWGILRRVVPDKPASNGTTFRWSSSLPYGRSDAPLARLLQMVGTGEQTAAVPWLGWVSGLFFALALSLLLGGPVLLLTLFVVGLVFLARALVERKRGPALCLALLDVGIPWLLGAAVVKPDAGDAMQLWLGQAILLAAAFTVLQWGVYRARFSAGRRLVGLWLGQLLLVGALIVLREPWAVAVAVLLLAPPIWWLARRAEREAGMTRSLPWWWAAMLSVAMIVR